MLKSQGESTIKIRQVQEQDAERISEINLICWQTAYRGLIADEVLDGMSLTPTRLRRFQEGIRQIPIYLCAEKDGVIMGYIAGGKTRETEVPYPFEVYFLYIHPDFQRQGIGKCLMRAFQKEIGFQPFCVYMLDGNNKALAFYQKMGGARQPKYDRDAIVRNLKTHDLCLGFLGNVID